MHTAAAPKNSNIIFRTQVPRRIRTRRRVTLPNSQIDVPDIRTAFQISRYTARAPVCPAKTTYRHRLRSTRAPAPRRSANLAAAIPALALARPTCVHTCHPRPLVRRVDPEPRTLSRLQQPLASTRDPSLPSSRRPTPRAAAHSAYMILPARSSAGRHAFPASYVPSYRVPSYRRIALRSRRSRRSGAADVHVGRAQDPAAHTIQTRIRYRRHQRKRGCPPRRSNDPRIGITPRAGMQRSQYHIARSMQRAHTYRNVPPDALMRRARVARVVRARSPSFSRMSDGLCAALFAVRGRARRMHVLCSAIRFARVPRTGILMHRCMRVSYIAPSRQYPWNGMEPLLLSPVQRAGSDAAPRVRIFRCKVKCEIMSRTIDPSASLCVRTSCRCWCALLSFALCRSACSVHRIMNWIRAYMEIRAYIEMVWVSKAALIHLVHCPLPWARQQHARPASGQNGALLSGQKPPKSVRPLRLFRANAHTYPQRVADSQWRGASSHRAFSRAGDDAAQGCFRFRSCSAPL